MSLEFVYSCLKNILKMVNKMTVNYLFKYLIIFIIGTVIGAGFASGKEVFTFFNVYGVAGLLGLIFSEAMIGLVIYKSFCIIINYNVSSYSQFVSRIFPQSKFLNNTFCNIINIFLLISLILDIIITGWCLRPSHLGQSFSYSSFLLSELFLFQDVIYPIATPIMNIIKYLTK